MQVSDQTARAVAREYADELVEATERHLGVELHDDQYDVVSTSIEAGVVELVQDSFREL